MQQDTDLQRQSVTFFQKLNNSIGLILKISITLILLIAVIKGCASQNKGLKPTEAETINTDKATNYSDQAKKYEVVELLGNENKLLNAKLDLVKKVEPGLHCKFNQIESESSAWCHYGETIDEEQGSRYLEANKINFDNSKESTTSYVAIQMEFLNSFSNFSKDEVLSRYKYNEEKLNKLIPLFLSKPETLKIKRHYLSIIEPCRKAIELSEEDNIQIACHKVSKGIYSHTIKMVSGNVIVNSMSPDSVEITIEMGKYSSKLPSKSETTSLLDDDN